MQKRHQTLLSSNHDFLVSEIPMDATLEAIRGKQILSWHDFEQIKTLRHQGRRALARYLLAVLPHRGSKAFQAFLESLQEANAQHLVDLLLQQAGAMNMEDLFKTPPPGTEDVDDIKGKGPRKTPSDSPLPPGPDPHEYAVKLTRNARYIRRFVDPADISPVLTQNKVITAREADMVLHLNGRNKKWDLLMAALLQRGERAYQAFMAALLQKEYNKVFHAIQETSTGPSGSEDSEDSDDFDDKDADDNADDNVLESDEEIKQETSKSRKQSGVAEDLFRDSANGYNYSRADDILLKKSRDLQTPDDEVPESPARISMRNGSRMQDADNNDWSSYDGGNYGNDANDNGVDNNMNSNGSYKRGQRRISNAGILGSVREETED